MGSIIQCQSTNDRLQLATILYHRGRRVIYPPCVGPIPQWGYKTWKFDENIWKWYSFGLKNGHFWTPTLKCRSSYPLTTLKFWLLGSMLHMCKVGTDRGMDQRVSITYRDAESRVVYCSPSGARPRGAGVALATPKTLLATPVATPK